MSLLHFSTTWNYEFTLFTEKFRTLNVRKHCYNTFFLIDGWQIMVVQYGVH